MAVIPYKETKKKEAGGERGRHTSLKAIGFIKRGKKKKGSTLKRIRKREEGSLNARVTGTR